MKRLITLIIVATFTMSSCAQKKTKEAEKSKNKSMMIPVSEKYKDITADNFVNKIYNQVKHYDREPRYFLRPTQNNCVFEILVNDILVHKEYSMEVLGSPKSVNHAILKSGPQTVTVRMYPLGDAMIRTYGTKDSVNTLLPNTTMNISVVKYEAFNLSQDLDDEIVVTEHQAPTKKGSAEFIGAGLPYYEYSFTFQAKVPYEIEGWNDGQDLTKFDEKELNEQVLVYYHKLKDVYLNENEDALAKSYFGDILLIAQAKFSSETDIQEMWDEIRGNLYFKNKDFEPFENYVMNFYGNGKIVALRHPSFEPVDRRLRGKSAFWFKYDTRTSIRAFYPSIDLYLPKGEPLENLRRIEY